MEDKRISRDTQYIAIAGIIAMRGTCRRLQVGAVITQANRIVATGYNGPLEHEPTCIQVCDSKNHCQRAIHAEANAISFSARAGIALAGSTIYCTHSPCMKCCELIIQSGITKVVYEEEFRDVEGLERLKANKVEVIKYVLS